MVVTANRVFLSIYSLELPGNKTETEENFEGKFKRILNYLKLIHFLVIYPKRITKNIFCAKRNRKIEKII